MTDTGMRAPENSDSLLRSFSYAFQGLVHVLRHQRNMRIHFALALVALIASLFFNLTRLELIAVFFAITLVLVSELLNTALETVIDLVTGDYDQRAKIAKDVAAGAVLVSAVNALIVAYFVFADKAASLTMNILTEVRRSAPYLTSIALVIVILVVIALKATGGHARLSGGLPSAHAAVAFGAWIAVTFVASGTQYGILISALTFLMALLTAQSRVEAGIHRPLEVVLGAVLGVTVVTLIFQLWF